MRDHIQVLIDRFKRKEAQARESGTCQEHTELDNAVEQIIAMESTESEETYDMNAKKGQDRAKAESMRNKAMETHGKRKADETGTSGSSSNKRRSGGLLLLLVYLREKAVQEQSLRQEELKLKQAQHELESKKVEAMITQQIRMEAQQAEMLQMMR